MAGRAAAAGLVGSWEDLSLKIQQFVRERSLPLHAAGRRGLREAIDGPASSQALVRTFGAREEDIRLTFFRDNHAWCPYCHKVWMQLEEKRIPYRVEKINMNCYGQKKRSFLRKTPRGLLPAIELDGVFQTESSAIMETIERAFPERPLLPPPGSSGHRKCMQLMDLERQLFGAWLYWLRGDESQRAQRQFEAAMDSTERALDPGPFFAGRSFTLVDCVFASSLERIAASMLYYKGLRIRGADRWPRVNAWFDELERRESYLASRSDFHTHCHDLPPQIGGCIPSGTGMQRAAAREIDGADGRSWHLPLPPLNEASLEPGAEEPLLDRLEAANALAHCWEGIVLSAGADEHGDRAFRYVAAALLHGVDAVQRSPDRLEKGALAPSAAGSLRHTRDRISVPRDMSFAAARQLRAHLNWAADILDPSGRFQPEPLRGDGRYDVDPARFYPHSDL